MFIPPALFVWKYTNTGAIDKIDKQAANKNALTVTGNATIVKSLTTIWAKYHMQKNDFKTISLIAKRALTDIPALNNHTDHMSLMMDIEFTHEASPIKLDELLAADPGNFGHDIIGIHNHFNRETKKLENGFSPRYTA